MKLLLDEMWPPAIATELGARGHDVVVVVHRNDLRSKPDWHVFTVAQAEERAIVTEDVGGYRKLAAQAILGGETHAGIILTTNHAFPRGNPRTAGRLVSSLHELLVSGIDLMNREHWLRRV